MGLTNRRPPKKRFFYIIIIFFLTLTVKKFQGISNLTISADLHRILAPKLRFSKLEKTIPMFLKTVF